MNRRNSIDITLCASRNDDGVSGMRDARRITSSETPRAQPQTFSLSSESFQNGAVIPEQFARDNGISPQLSWTNPPHGTQRFVIIMDDPDARAVVGHTFVHWVACVPTNEKSIDEGASTGGWAGKPKVLSGDRTSTAYRGPRPPFGTHRYYIAIYAMSSSFKEPDFKDLASSTAANNTRTYTREHFESLFRSDILASAQICGLYSADRRMH